MFVVFKLAVYVILPLTLAVLGTRLKRTRSYSAGQHLMDRLLFWYLVIAVGVAGTLSGLSQMFNGKMTAELNDWPYSPFVIELGFMNFAFGILGLLCLRIKSTWWYAVGVGYGIFMALAAYYHIYSFVALNDQAAGNSPMSVVFWTDVLVAVALLALSILHARYVRAGQATKSRAR